MSANKLSRREVGQLAVLGLGGWGVSQIFQAFRPLGRDISSNAAAQLVLSDPAAPRVGPSDANLTMAVFTDYQCPICRQAYPEMKKAVADHGHVAVIYEDWPIFGPISERAARVALAANLQGIYSQVHDAMMTHRGALNETAFEEAVAGAGGSWERIKADLATHGEKIGLQLRLNQGKAFSLNLAGTPAYLIGERLIEGALNTGQFKRAFGRAQA